MAEALEFDVTLDKDDYTDGLLKILRAVRPQWAPDEIKIKSMRQGYVNRMLSCSIDDNQEDWLVARIFGSGLDPAGGLGFRRQREVKCSKALAELNLGPLVYATFRNGLLSGFVTGATFSWMDLSAFRELDIARAAARAFARIHSRQSSDYAIRNYGIGDGQSHNTIMRQLLVNWPEVIIDPETTDWCVSQIPPLEERLAEFDSLLYRFDALDIPETLCHGDPNPTNMIYNKKEDSITLVDYEMVGIMNPLYDLAGFLGTSAFGMAPDIEGLEHSKEYQTSFLKEYLEELERIDKTGSLVTEEKIKDFYNILQVMIMTLHFALHIFAAHLANSPNDSAAGSEGKGFLSLSLRRLEYYYKHRERVLSTKLPGE